MWGKIFPEIQCKKFQSPIHIFTDQCTYDSRLVRRPFIVDIDDNCCQTLENTGHSFQVTGKSYSRKFMFLFLRFIIWIERYYLSSLIGITGGPVSDEYQFLQFHMHWGSNNLEGAEHVIDGVRLPGEVRQEIFISFTLI